MSATFDLQALAENGQQGSQQKSTGGAAGLRQSKYSQSSSKLGGYNAYRPNSSIGVDRINRSQQRESEIDEYGVEN
jgi:hypothetical protein